MMTSRALAAEYVSTAKLPCRGPNEFSNKIRAETIELAVTFGRVPLSFKNNRALGVGDGQKNVRSMVCGGGNSRQPGVGGSTGERCRTRERVSIPFRRAEGRQSYRCGSRDPGRSERVLRRRRLRRGLEVSGRRKSLGANLRQAAGRRYRCSRRRALGAEHGVGRHTR